MRERRTKWVLDRVDDGMITRVKSPVESLGKVRERLSTRPQYTNSLSNQAKSSVITIGLSIPIDSVDDSAQLRSLGCSYLCEAF